MNRYLTIISICVLLAMNATGCMMLGPDYRTPTAPLESDWLEAGDPLVGTTPPLAPDWWQGAFNDPLLDRLVAAALSQNLSLRSAGLRVLQARSS
jgi:outer membrane protein TolC